MLAVLRGDCKIDLNATDSVNSGSVCLYCDSLNKNTIEKKIQENPLQNKSGDIQSDSEANQAEGSRKCTFICQECYDKLSLDRYIAERKTQENEMPEEIEKSEKLKTEEQKASDKNNASNMSTEEKVSTKEAKLDCKVDKTTVSIPPQIPVTPRVLVPSFTKTSPNDMYRRLLPAVLFVLTFVTVMTILLIYMDTVALGAQQFRLNMSRDYELARISQRAPDLLRYVRQLHLAPRAPGIRPPPHTPTRTDRVDVIDRILGDDYNGTFLEFLPAGPRNPTTLYLELVRSWDGLVVRASARDHLAMRGTVSTLNACLSPTQHPREITYQPSSSSPSWFSPRVLCLPLGTVLSISSPELPALVQLSGPHVEQAVTTLPLDLRVKILEIFFTDPLSRNRTTNYLQTIDYTVAANFEDSVMYQLNDN